MIKFYWHKFTYNNLQGIVDNAKPLDSRALQTSMIKSMYIKIVALTLANSHGKSIMTTTSYILLQAN